MFGAVASLFSGKVTMPWDPVKEFANADMGDTTKITANANAFVSFWYCNVNHGAEKIHGSSRPGGFIYGAVATALVGKTGITVGSSKNIFSSRLGCSNMYRAECKSISQCICYSNLESFQQKAFLENVLADWLDQLQQHLHGKTVMPWDQVKLFAEADMGDSTRRVTIAKALGDFGTAISNMPALPELKRDMRRMGICLKVYSAFALQKCHGA